MAVGQEAVFRGFCGWSQAVWPAGDGAGMEIGASWPSPHSPTCRAGPDCPCPLDSNS